MKFHSAAIVVPQNSFLKGYVNQDHSQLLKKIVEFLKNTGYDLKKVSILEEKHMSVAYEIGILVQLYDIIIIFLDTKSECVSKALANITQQELVKIYNLDDFWPKSTKLLKTNSYPIIYLQRIFIIAKDSIEDQLNILKDHLIHYKSQPLYSKNFHIILNGSKQLIENLQKENLKIKLKKSIKNKKEFDLLTLTAKEFENIVKGEMILRNSMDFNIKQSQWEDYMGDLIYENQDKHLQKSKEIIEKCLEDFGPENVFLSFNGGKDCTVLLHLVQTVLKRKYPNRKEKLLCLYVRSNNSFKEQDEFIDQCMIFYNLEIMSLTSNIKEALEVTINQNPNLKACFMGTRKTDPFCSDLTSFQKTDPDWPEIMRCSPFLDWSYSDIWDYLLYYKVPYCKLYDYGFTSLGNFTNTIRNPSLLFSEGDREIYLPAYKLLNEKKERSGRNISKI